GIVDFFWLARLLRANVSREGQVTFNNRQKSWLELLALHFDYMADFTAAREMRRAERVLRGVLDYACDVIQNAVEVTCAWEVLRREPERFPKGAPAETAGWRQNFDEELHEIAKQRHLRTSGVQTHLFEPRDPHTNPDPNSNAPRRAWWSRRTVTGEYPDGGVIGVAISGGGIRSATFGLGILQGLQEFDLLRSADYVSTVSGGGYVGAWLVANVLRTPYWLGRQISWDESIAHLRKHARYLAPHGGLFSADTWTIFGIWSRNAVLVQLTGAAWLLTALALCLMARTVFSAVDGRYTVAWLGWPADQLARVTAGVLLAVISVFTGWNLYRTDGTRRKDTTPGWGETAVLWGIVMPAWAVAFLTAALMWSAANGHSSNASPVWHELQYSKILAGAWKPWWPLLSLQALVFASLGGFLMRPARPVEATDDEPNFWGTVRIALGSIVAALLSTGVMYLIYCAMMWLFRRWSAEPSQHGWYAMVFGPAMVTVAVAAAVVMFIGLCGRSSPEGTREWWTRMGSWLGMSGIAFHVIGVAAVLSPWWLLLGFGKLGTLKLASVGGIVGTIISAVASGNSSKTGKGQAKSPDWREYLARFGAILFIVSGLFAVALLLHAFLVNASTNLSVSAATYWTALDQFSLQWIGGAMVVTLLLGLLLSWRVDLNIFGLNSFYRNRLVRCYLGASRWRPGMRKPNRFTDFDEADDVELRKLKTTAVDPADPDARQFRGPFPIVNCTVNLGGSDDLGVVTRQSAAFSMTPLRCGSERDRIGYAPTELYDHPVLLGHAIAVSGAAASPNMGYSTSALVSFLLTMFNVRLGWWFPNPSGGSSQRGNLSWKGFGYLAEELFGAANETSDYLNLSDGGHFENLGIYEL
ncbi:MAG: hypothetical protein JWN34_4685, partial [Bryobacterales bacterium]|nr:hypothetical protein [Bryobacterales bacterium]